MNFIGIIGIFVLLGLAWLMSYDKKNIPFKIIFWGIPAGILAILSYGIVVWSMQYLEIAYVSSIRETSIVLATLMGFFILNEKKARDRMLPAVLVVIGITIVYFQI